MADAMERLMRAHEKVREALKSEPEVRKLVSLITNDDDGTGPARTLVITDVTDYELQHTLYELLHSGGNYAELEILFNAVPELAKFCRMVKWVDDIWTKTGIKEVSPKLYFPDEYTSISNALDILKRNPIYIAWLKWRERNI